MELDTINLSERTQIWQDKAFYVLFYFLNISFNLQVIVPNFEYQ